MTRKRINNELIQKFYHTSHFEPDFKGKKSKLLILQQFIIYLKYLVLDTSLKNQAHYDRI